MEPRNLPIKVLIVEDDDGFAHLERTILERISDPLFVVERVSCLREAIVRLSQGNIDLVLLDLFLPDSQSLETLIRLRHSCSWVAIVVLTGISDGKTGLLAIQEGADDYLLKDQLNQRLMPRVLEYAVERRYHEMVKLKLLEAEKKARTEAEHSVGIRDEFLLIASHELKTPLNSLKMQVELFQNEFRQMPQAAHLEKLCSSMDRNIQRFSALIESLTELSQFQLGKIILKKSWFNLTELVKEVILGVQSELNASKCSVQVTGDPEVRGNWDWVRCQEVMCNLLINSAKYAPGGPIEVKILALGDSAQVEVHDRGPGISEESMKRIFNRFERVEAGKGVLGLGLGLYLAQQIVQGHGGKISVQSELGRGTIFTVQLPLREAEASDKPQLKVA